MTRRRTVGMLAGVVLCLLVQGTAIAQECPETPGSPEAAREVAGQMFAEGQQLYRDGNHRDALERFLCSFRAVPHPNTLYNIGECKEALGDVEGALQSYRSYLELFPDGAGRSQAEVRIRALEPQVEALHPAANGESSESPSSTVEPGVEAPDVPMRMSRARLFAWISLGVGVAVTATGAGLYLGYVDVHDEFLSVQQEDPVTVTEAELEEMRDRGRSMEIAGAVLMGVGIAVLAAMVVLFAFFDGEEPVSEGERARNDSHFGVAPTLLGSDGGGLLLTGRF